VVAGHELEVDGGVDVEAIDERLLRGVVRDDGARSVRAKLGRTQVSGATRVIGEREIGADRASVGRAHARDGCASGVR